MLSNLQIQTIDGCNARCSFCPAWQIPRTFKTIDDKLFKRIVSDFLETADTKTRTISLFLENEPLLDNNIFEKARWIKQQGKNICTTIHTNGSLLLNFNKQDYHLIDRITITVAEDVETYNKIHSLNISKKTLNEIQNLPLYFPNIRTNVRKNTILSGLDFNSEKYSRAGFLNNNKTVNNKTKGCKKYLRGKWANVLYDGTFIICCMDYNKEIVFGNLKTQSIGQIINSDYYNSVFDKIEGEIESEDSFICKRCEKSIHIDEEFKRETRFTGRDNIRKVQSF